MRRLLPYFERISEGAWRCVRPVTMASSGRIFHLAPEDTFTIGQVRGRFDIAFELEHAYDFEAQVLVDLLRLSRLTLLYGAQGAGKTTLLRTGVLPLLQHRAEDRKIARRMKPQGVVLFPDPRASDAAGGRSAEIAIVFDRWADVPLAALHASIADMLPVKSARAAEPGNLSENLAAWNKEHGLRFFIILDCFEQYLRAPRDGTGIVEFEYEFVRMLNQPRLPAHFLLSLRDDAEPLLNRFKEHINGFGDAFLRLPDWHRAPAPPVAPRSQRPRGATNHVSIADRTANVQTDTGSIRNRDALVAASLARAAETSLKPEHLPAGETRFEFNAMPSLALRRASTGILLAQSIAAFAVILAAMFITIYAHQEASTPQPITIERATAADIGSAVDRPRIHVLTEVPAAPRDIQVPVGLQNIEAPGGPSAAAPVPARAAKPVPSAARRMRGPEKVKMAPSAPKDWKSAMLQEIEACGAKSFLSRIACVEHVRWKHCAPDRWNTIPACAGTPRVTLLE